MKQAATHSMPVVRLKNHPENILVQFHCKQSKSIQKYDVLYNFHACQKLNKTVGIRQQRSTYHFMLSMLTTWYVEATELSCIPGGVKRMRHSMTFSRVHPAHILRWCTVRNPFGDVLTVWKSMCRSPGWRPWTSFQVQNDPIDWWENNFQLFPKLEERGRATLTGLRAIRPWQAGAAIVQSHCRL